jgi:pSer/pThr/pTyr-binding forkhead associated (FHA) protein
MTDVTLGLPDGSEHRLESQAAVGRDEVCDVRLESKTVSRRHAIVFERDGRWWIADTGSFNGTFINGDRVPPGVALQLHHADRIRIGSESRRRTRAPRASFRAADERGRPPRIGAPWRGIAAKSRFVSETGQVRQDAATSSRTRSEMSKLA